MSDHGDTTPRKTTKLTGEAHRRAVAFGRLATEFCNKYNLEYPDTPAKRGHALPAAGRRSGSSRSRRSGPAADR